MRLISVAVPVPYLDSLTYTVPDQYPELPPIGARVRVPVGARTVVGCVVGHDAAIQAGTETRDIADVVDQEPLLPSAIVDLCKWVADYYMAGIGDAIGAALPPGSRRASAFKTTRVVAAVTGEEADVPRLTSKQRDALAILKTTRAGIRMSALHDHDVSADVVRRLVRRGLAVVRHEPIERDPFDRAALSHLRHDPARQLTEEQRSALATLTSLADARRFQVALLHGVTGSGKTEIYLRLAAHVSDQGRQVLLMVPEISLTPSVVALCRSAFGSRVAIQHSGLSDGERHDQWQRIRTGAVDVVVGTRSAVFAPLANPGLIIVDEEHDSSYKQDESPRYHGRDVAIVRGRAAGALVVLGSATPSIETYQNAAGGKYVRVALDRRVLDRPLASVALVNMRDEYADEGPDIVISRALQSAIAERLSKREQVLVLLNRRGFATAVFCRQCGDSLECPNCNVSLTVHRQRDGWTARCHYCNHSTAVPKVCRRCAAPYLEHVGFGTAKIEQQLIEMFPEARIARVDRDSVRRRGALTALLSKFAAGDIDVLVGTQMIAKGHDFPRVTLVGVVSADVGLGLADFRAAERTFQLLTQVAGRAGRGDSAGDALIQTLFPEHYSIRVACRQDYLEFVERELMYRRKMCYPPAVALVNTLVRGKTFAQAMQTAVALVRRLETSAARTPFTILGPAPAPLARLRGEHRVQFFLKGNRRGAMRDALRGVLAEMPDVRRRVTVDVDPINVL